MAIRSHSEVGQIRGKLGNTITRYRNKKYVVYSVPSQINFSKSKAAVTARKRFAYLVQFAKVINCNSELKEIWKRSSFKGTNAYQKIIKHNSPFISNTGLTKLNFITPSGLGVFSPYINFDVDELFINSSLFNTDRLKPKTFFCLFSIQNQEGANLQLVTSSEITLENDLITGKIQLPDDLKLLIESSEFILLLTAFSFNSANPKAISYTCTISYEIYHEDHSPVFQEAQIKKNN